MIGSDRHAGSPNGKTSVVKTLAVKTIAFKNLAVIKRMPKRSF